MCLCLVCEHLHVLRTTVYVALLRYLFCSGIPVVEDDAPPLLLLQKSVFQDSFLLLLQLIHAGKCSSTEEIESATRVLDLLLR